MPSIPAAPEVQFTNFPSSGPEVAHKTKFRKGMDVAQTEQALAEIRDGGEKKELGAVFDPHGRLWRVTMGVAKSDGGTAAVDLSKLLDADEEHGAIEIPGGPIMTHSHPQGLPLSSGDLIAMAKRGIREVRAVGLCTYSMVGAPKAMSASERENTMLQVGITYDQGSTASVAKARAKFGGSRLNLVTGTGSRTLELTDEKHFVNRALAAFAGCEAVASKMGWTFTTTAGNFAAFADMLIEREAPGAKVEATGAKSTATAGGAMPKGPPKLTRKLT